MNRRECLVAFAFLLSSSSATAQVGLEAWHADGQTWIVWTDDRAFAAGETYDVYRAASPITSLTDAERVGRVLPEDWTAKRLRISTPGSTWTIPDGSGGAVALAVNQALFVYTPRTRATEYFAVVKGGETAIGAENSIGPIPQTIDAPTCHAVAGGLNAGHPYTVYALWIDGDDDIDGGRANFPVLGNASARGTAALFGVFEPTGGLPAGELPAVLALHGGGGSYWKLRPSVSDDVLLDLHVEDGLYVTLDDSIYAYTQTGAGSFENVSRTSTWFGYWNGWDRFGASISAPPVGAVIHDYTQRKIDAILDWLIRERSVDEHRVSLFGVSMGGRGTSFYSRARPERLSAAIDFVGGYTMNAGPIKIPMQGTPALNLRTNLPGDVRIADFYWPAYRVHKTEMPFCRFVHGTNDASNGWADKPGGFRAIDALRWGAHIYWDERGHSGLAGDWDGAHFAGSTRHDPSALTRYRNDRSFPAISNIDHLPGVPARQPDPGDDTEPANGNPFGTWGGWVDWDSATLSDDATSWAVTLFLVSASSVPNDDSPTAGATCDLTIRRAQEFHPRAGELLRWSLTSPANQVLQSGEVRCQADGSVTVEGVELRTLATRFHIARSWSSR